MIRRLIIGNGIDEVDDPIYELLRDDGDEQSEQRPLDRLLRLLELIVISIVGDELDSGIYESADGEYGCQYDELESDRINLILRILYQELVIAVAELQESSEYAPAHSSSFHAVGRAAFLQCIRNQCIGADLSSAIFFPVNGKCYGKTHQREEYEDCSFHFPDLIKRSCHDLHRDIGQRDDRQSDRKIYESLERFRQLFLFSFRSSQLVADIDRHAEPDDDQKAQKVSFDIVEEIIFQAHIFRRALSEREIGVISCVAEPVGIALSYHHFILSEIRRFRRNKYGEGERGPEAANEEDILLHAN